MHRFCVDKRKAASEAKCTYNLSTLLATKREQHPLPCLLPQSCTEERISWPLYDRLHTHTLSYDSILVMSFLILA